MKINRNNYELYFLDYLDGNLSDHEIGMLEDFLLLNPDLREELEGTERFSIHPESIVFKPKEFLKKPDLTLPVNDSNFEDFCVAEAEGDLNHEQKLGLRKYADNKPETKKILGLYLRLRLTPDENTVFAGKGNLKKKVLFIPLEIIIPALSVAAAVVFMLFFYFYNEEIRQNIPGLATDLSTAITSKPDLVKPELKNLETSQNRIVPDVQKAANIAVNSPKEKKQTPDTKKDDLPAKNSEEKDIRNPSPIQRLNPSIQIKLPYIAYSPANIPLIDGSKIIYSKLTLNQPAPEYMSISEYARKQLTEKIHGINNPENTRLSAWQIADAGVSGINKLTGGKMKLEKTSDDNGVIKAYSFKSKLLSFSSTAVR